MLVGCEYSGKVRRACRNLGHDAWSCDLLPAEDGSKWHIQEDITKILNEEWDMLIGFPPCTHLASSGARWFKQKIADGRQQQGIDFFMTLAGCGIEKIAIENPIGIMSTVYRKPDQIIQPWQFGHGETKATCLWLKGLPKLEATDVVEGREQRIWRMPPSKDRAHKRSETYEGIANAMAQQWAGKEEG